MAALPPPKIELWRRFRGLTQRELANRAGVTQTTISLLENKGQVPLASTVQKLSRALDCTPSELYLSPITDDGNERRT